MRPVEEKDWDDVCRIVINGQSAWSSTYQESPEEIRHRLEGPGRNLWICGGGFLAWFPEEESKNPRPECGPGDFHIGALFVEQKLWGTGLSARMLGFALSSIRESGGRHVRLWTPEVALRARGFYQKQGFRESGRSFSIKSLRRLEYVLPLED